MARRSKRAGRDSNGPPREPERAEDGRRRTAAPAVRPRAGSAQPTTIAVSAPGVTPSAEFVQDHRHQGIDVRRGQRFAGHAHAVQQRADHDVDDDLTGIELVKSHFPETSELHLIAVAPAHHRQGIGSRLLRTIEEDLRSDGVQLLTVHTVGPSYENAAYANTREFFQSSGFLPTREVTNIDWDGPTLVLVKPLT